MELDHFLHQHRLKLSEIDGKDFVVCEGCDERVWGRSYCCHTCKFYLHETCTNMPAQICHFMHSCPLILDIYKSMRCDACGERCRGFFYECGRCDWRVDYACTLKQLPNTSTNPVAQEQLEAPLHRHPLSIVENIREVDGVLCEVCEELCFGPIYECSVCDFYVHKSCVEIPRQLYSVYHDCHYFLILFIRRYYDCGACMRGGFGVCYACICCGFKLHLKCALRFAGNINKDLQLEHICHSTGALQKKTDCLGCKFPLEKPFSEHLLEIQTPLHPQHTLFLCEAAKRRRCSMCLHEFSSGLFFRCDKCDFNCDSKCIYLMPTVKFVNHDSHMLTVVDKICGEAKCNACRNSCSDRAAFRCSECKFTLHLLCGPLPHTIKYDHIHRLTLEDFIIYNINGQYCYYCEEERDPLLPVYNCKKCSYTVEIDCVTSEVTACLRGEREEHVALRCVNRPLTKENKVIIRRGAMEEQNKAEQNNVINEDLSEVLETEPSFFLNRIVDYLNEDELNEFRDTIKTMVEELTWASKYDDLNYDIDECFEDDFEEKCSEHLWNEGREPDHGILDVPSYSEKAFARLLEDLDCSIYSRKRIRLVFSRYEKQLLMYGEYITPRIFIYILKELVNGKHGDISSGSMLDPRVKSICFMYLAELIYSMQTTKLMQIKKEMLQTWWNRTKMLQLVGFKVDFIQDHLMLVARAYFGLRATDLAIEISQSQVSKIEQLKKEIEKHKKEIKVLTERVEKLEVEHNNHLEHMDSITNPLMVNCVRGAEAMKWRPAADSLL